MVDGGWPLVKQLARVALVDEGGQVLMDELVQPERPVVDHLTRYSGVTAELLATATLSFRQAQERVKQLARGRDIRHAQCGATSTEGGFASFNLAHVLVRGAGEEELLDHASRGGMA